MEFYSKDATKEPVGFFAAFHRLGRQIDEGVKNAQKQLNDRHLDWGSSKHTALKSLLDCKKELNTMKPISRSTLKELRKKGKRFDESVQACSEVTDLQLQQLSALQAHLMQYGFVQQPEGEDGAEEETEDSESENVECPTTPSQESEAREEKGEKKKKPNLTPRLEDFGVSSYTLKMLNRPTQAPPARLQTRPKAPQHHDSVPDMFKNEGLTVTPSLFSSNPYGTGNRSAYEVFSLAYSPDQEPQDSTEMEGSREVAKTLDFSDSPVPPVLHTPGIKQIPRTGEVVPPPPGRRGPVARQLNLGGSVPDQSLDSPIPPVLSTPGIQQISSKSAAPRSAAHQTNQAPVGGYDPLGMPKTPEFTYSLRDLEDITVSIRQTELSSTFGERSATASSDLDMSSAAALSSAHHSVHAGRGPPPLPPPTVSWSKPHAAGPKFHDPVMSGHTRSDQMMASLAVSEPQLSSWSRGGGGGGDSLDLPPSPELTMSYTTRPRVTADNTLSSSSLYSSSQQRHSRFEEENLRHGEESHGGRGPQHLSSAAHPGSHYHPGALSHHKETEPFEKRTGGFSNKQSGFVSAHPSNSGSFVTDTGRGVLYSKENILPTTRSEAYGKADAVVKDSALPHQPVLRHPQSEGALDMPSTPNFFGSYHFMGSRH